LIVNAKALWAAMQDRQSGQTAFLDRQSGQVVSTPEVTKDARRLPERFVRIEPLPSSAGWHIMADFAQRQPSGEHSDALNKALKSRHPFRRFQEALAPNSPLYHEWQNFFREARLEIARVWLTNHEIEADLG
jgi:hypothetical protein